MTSQSPTIDEPQLLALLERLPTRRWYAVGTPWGDGTHIVEGSEDPHGAPFVADCESFSEELPFNPMPAEARAALIADVVNAAPGLLKALLQLRRALATLEAGICAAHRYLNQGERQSDLDVLRIAYQSIACESAPEGAQDGPQ